MDENMVPSIIFFSAAVFKQPSYLTIEDSNEQSIQISWTTPDDDGDAQKIRDYEVTWKKGDGEVETEFAAHTFFDLSNLKSNTRYNITVAARGADNNAIGEMAIEEGITRKLISK